MFTPHIPDGTPFTLNNIPFGIISTDTNPQPRGATAIGGHAVDLSLYWQNMLKNESQPPIAGINYESLLNVFNQSSLNSFAALPSSCRSEVREQLIHALKRGAIPEECFVPLDQVRMHLPMKIGGFSDFFCSLEHCQNCSSMTGPVAKNFFHAPSVYNARASSVVASPQAVRRPKGVMYDTGKGSGNPVYRPSERLDFELEMGYFVSKPIDFGETLGIENAPEHIFGFVLLNDWSSRDIQAFEMPPLGPFHSKGFGTSISPWVVTLDALKPFACQPTHDHSANEFAHLRWNDRPTGTFDIRLTASLERAEKRHTVTRSNLRYLYWSPYQQLAHHASAGCGLGTGDLLGSGTISGEHEGELGCLFEATQNGDKPIQFQDGTSLKYLMDYDEVILEGWCGEGDNKIGFGECRGMLLPARE